MQAHGDFLRWYEDDLSRAKSALKGMERSLEQVRSNGSLSSLSFLHPWFERAVERAEAIVEMIDGDQSAGMAALEEAAAAELALPIVFGPPLIFKPSYEILGEMHLAAGRMAEAAEAFEKSLRLAPGRRLSLEGLEAARAGG